MSIQPTISFAFSPTCTSFRCCCCSGDDEDTHVYPEKSGLFKYVGNMSDEEVKKANVRFKEIIIKKIDPLPLNNEDFLDRLEMFGLSLEVSREHPLTKKRLDETVNAINKMLSDMHVD